MDSETIIEMYIKKVGYKPEAILWTRRGVVPKYNTVEQVVKALYYSSTRAEAGARLGYGQTQSPGTIKGLEKALRERAGTLFKDKIGFNNYRNFINNYMGYHYCDGCEELYTVDNFPIIKRKKVIGRAIEYRNFCDECYKVYQNQKVRAYKNTDRGRAVVNKLSAKRRAGKLHRRPSWVNDDDMQVFYEEASRRTLETGVQYHVDHIIPLQGIEVSGLDIPDNLQVITEPENLTKSNKYNDEGWIYEHNEHITR